jgi:hypothetical protein
MTSANPSRLGEQITAMAVFGAVIILFAFYGAYFVRTLVPLSTELAALALTQHGWRGADTAYAMMLAVWGMIAGEGLIAARTLSLLAAVAAIVLVFRVGRKLTADPVTAALLTLNFVLFPPLVATLVCATPHAVALLFALVAMDLILSASQRSPRAARLYGGLAGVLAALAILMVPLGGVMVPLWLVLCAALTKQAQAAVIALIVVIVSAALMLAFGIHAPVIDVDLASAGHNSVWHALILPYAMVPVTILLGAVAVFSPSVRHAVGLDRALAVLCAPLVMFVILWVAMASGTVTVGQLVTAMGYGFCFAIFAPWPLIVWVRRVMPQVKSLGAWIVFPVIMYSCFWVILGPVDPGKFPYSHRQILQP